MRRFFFASVALVVSFLGTPVVGAQDAEGSPGTVTFDPLKHLPQDSLVVVSVDRVGRLIDRLGGTLIGRMLTHPGWREAFASPLKLLGEQVDGATSEVKEITGHDLGGLVGLLRGRVVLSLRGLSQAGMPELVLAIELGENRDGILQLVGRLAELFEKQAGVELQRQEIGGVEVTVWPTPVGAAVSAVLGGHLLVTTSPDLMMAIDAAISGGDAQPFSSSVVHRGLAPHLGVPGREVLVEIDLDGLRELALRVGGVRSPDVELFLEASGLGRTSSFGYALGFDGSATRAALHLGTRDGSAGVLRVLADAFPPVRSLAGVLERMPANVDDVSALRVDPGKLLRAIDSLVRQSMPDADEHLGFFYEQLEVASGLSVKDDLMTLPAVTLHGFSVEPPLGGLFNDTMALVKTDELTPGWTLLERLAARQGARPKTLTAGGQTVEYINPADGAVERGGLLPALLEAGSSAPHSPAALAGDIEQAMTGLLFGGFTVARFERDDGWTVVSPSAQAVRRYVTHYSKAPSLAADDRHGAFADLARRKIVGSSYSTVFHAGRSLLWLYNTFLSIATSVGVYGSMVGIDVARLPPAEEFISASGVGYVRFGTGAEGLWIETRRGIESSALIAVVAGAAVGAGILLPALSSSRVAAKRVECEHNMRQLYLALASHALDGGGFLHSDDGSLAALNALLRTKQARGLRPENFLCPQGPELAAEFGDDGRFELDEGTCSYELVPWKIEGEKLSILLFDRHEHDSGARTVLFTDGHVESLDGLEFRERFERERSAAGKGR